MRNDYDAPEGEAFDEIYQSDGLRWMSVVVVLLVVFGFFSLAWYAYRTNTSSSVQEGEIMIVEGEGWSYKEAPQDPGGMEFPHQDKDIYNRLVAQDEQKAKPVERLLPPPEKPIVERQEALEPEEEATGWINEKLHPGKEEKPKEKLKETVQEAQQRKEEVAAQETKVPAYVPAKPVVKPWVPVDGDVKKEDMKQESKEASPAPVASVPEKQSPAEDPIVAQAEKFAMKKAPPAPKPAVVAPAGVSGGAVEVQLAALRSQAEAETMWKGLATRHRDLLSGKSHRIVSAEIPGKGTYYRLRVGAGSAAAATSLCSALTQRKQACILVR